MGLFSGLAKAGLAKKAIDEARKPHNQAKIKSLIAQARARGARGASGRARG